MTAQELWALRDINGFCPWPLYRPINNEYPQDWVYPTIWTNDANETYVSIKTESCTGNSSINFSIQIYSGDPVEDWNRVMLAMIGAEKFPSKVAYPIYSLLPNGMVAPRNIYEDDNLEELMKSLPFYKTEKVTKQKEFVSTNPLQTMARERLGAN